MNKQKFKKGGGDKNTDVDLSSRTILFLVNGLYPAKTGGIEIFHHYFIQAVSKQFKSTVITLDEVDLQGNNVETITVKLPFGRFQKILLIYHHLFEIIKKRREIGLIHIPYSSKSFFQFYHVMCIAQLLKIPYILRIHGGGMYPGRPDFMHAMYFKNAKKIIAVSEPIKTEYEKRYGKKIELIPSYLPFMQSSATKKKIRENLNISHNSLMILYVGSIKPIKGPDILVEAVRRLGHKFLKAWNILVLMVGGGELEDFLRKKVLETGLNDFIQFTGRVPYENVHRYFQASDVFVIPSLMEARPLVLAEALYNGLPSIGSDISTIANTIRHNETGLVFSSGSSKALAEAIMQMVQSPERRSVFRQNNLNNKHCFNHFDQMVQEYSALYKQIMVNKGGQELR